MRILATVSDQVWGGKQRYMLDLLMELATAGHEVTSLAESGSCFARFAGSEMDVRTVPNFTDLPEHGCREIQSLVDSHDCVIMSGRRDLLAVERMDLAGVLSIFIRHSAFHLTADETSAVRSLDLVVSTSFQQEESQFESLPRQLRDVWHSALSRDFLRRLDNIDRTSARKSFGLRDEDVAVVSLARLSWEKGVDRLLDAFSRVHGGSRGNAVLLVAGDGSERRELEHRADAIGMGEHVRFLGHLDDVAPILVAADIAVLASTVPETGPLALKEAMASHCAIIAPHIGGIPEFVRHDISGLLFEDQSILERHLATLIESAEHRERLADRAKRSILASHTWPVRGPVVDAALRRCVVQAIMQGRESFRQNLAVNNSRLQVEDWGALLFVPESSQIAEFELQLLPALQSAIETRSISAVPAHLLPTLNGMGMLRIADREHEAVS